MTGLRALLRLAVRDARRDRWRTVLIVAVVALPVAGLIAVATLIETTTATAEERVVDLMGTADVLLYPDLSVLGDADPLTDLDMRIPPDAVLEAHHRTTDQVVLPGRRLDVSLADPALAPDALSSGQYRVLEGREPAGAEEIALARALAERLDAGVGDVLRLDQRGEVEVVGLVLRPEDLRNRDIVVAPSTLGPQATLSHVLLRLPEGASPPTAGIARSGQAYEDPQPWYARSRDEELAQRFTTGERWFLVIAGGLAVVEVALIAGAAFAVSVRRRQRELGLVAATGGTRRHVRRLVLLTGAAAGTIGTLVGTALALLGVLAVSPWWESLGNREISGMRTDLSWVAGVVLIGVLAAVAGAWWPARTVSRLPVTVALSGRRPTPQPSSRGLRAGIVIAALGGGVTALASSSGALRGSLGPYVFLLGSVLVVLGAGLTSPWLLEQLGRLAPRLPAGPRMALRDAARFRTRNGPIVTAAMAGLAAAITVGTVIGALDTAAARRYEPTLPSDHLLVSSPDGEAWTRQAGDAVARELSGRTAPVTEAYVDAETLPRPADQNSFVGPAALGTPELAELLGGAAAVSALERGEVVLMGIDASEVELRSWSEDGEPTEAVQVAATTVPAPASEELSWSQSPRVLVPPALAGTPDDAIAHQMLVVVSEPVDEERFSRAAAAAEAAAPGAWVQAELGYRSPYAQLLTIVVIAGALAGLLLVAVAIALAAAEARADLRTLTAVGAGVPTRRSLAAGRALLLAGLGGVLAVPVGLVPAAAILLRVQSATFVVPWIPISLAVVAVPAIATVGAVLASNRSPLPALRLPS